MIFSLLRTTIFICQVWSRITRYEETQNLFNDGFYNFLCFRYVTITDITKIIQNKNMKTTIMKAYHAFPDAAMTGSSVKL